MAHAANHGQRRSGDGADQCLVIEGPQIFHRTPSTHQQQRVDFAASVGQGQCLAQHVWGLCPLHQRWIDDHTHMGRSSRECRQHVMQGGCPQRRDNANGTRLLADAALARRVEQPLALQQLAQTQELFVQRACTQAAHAFNHHLQLAPRLVHAQPTEHFDLLAIHRAEVHQSRRPAKHRATDQGAATLAVFQNKVTVATGRAQKATQFATHRQRTKPR